MQRILIDVDTQFDFVAPDGALYVPADGVEARIADQLEQAVAEGVPVLGSVDSHAYDAWEFAAQGGPFPTHCVKGTAGWLRVHPHCPPKTRFVPMQPLAGDEVQNLIGEATTGAGPRVQSSLDLAREAQAGVGLYFEKEVYSLFSNPAAAAVLAALVERCGGADAVRFDVLGYCTGGYCVDAAALGLRERGYHVRVLAAATAAIGGAAGAAKSQAALSAAGIEWCDA